MNLFQGCQIENSIRPETVKKPRDETASALIVERYFLLKALCAAGDEGELMDASFR